MKYNSLFKNLPQFSKSKTINDKFKIHVGIDFGTYGSGLAYSLNDGTVLIHNTWKHAQPTEKPKTAVLFNDNNIAEYYGDTAIQRYIDLPNQKGWKLFERFKMKLYGIFNRLLCYLIYPKI